ncbi:hypothetical protein [Capnocytophaga sp.]|uniref:hypothetical protein n=1 Tax=Capnocytophaga sp. TaxID=44737 RepID=UPI0026DD6D8F|nr:hypothetical protein [Capnocytophaga sp.]MDO5104547.1 hypothetical protein [Capnocytophaga sp.]
MATENLTSRINNLSNLNPVVIYDGIMEMIFQEDKKQENVAQLKNAPTFMEKVYKVIITFFKTKN